MTGLLDTHVFIWMAENPSQLSATAVQFLQDPANRLLLSVASVWEVVIKQGTGKLPLVNPLPLMLSRWAVNKGEVLTVTLDHVSAVQSLPTPHKDPFDRLLAAQAVVEGAVFVTADDIFNQYPVTRVW